MTLACSIVKEGILFRELKDVEWDGTFLGFSEIRDIERESSEVSEHSPQETRTV